MRKPVPSFFSPNATKRIVCRLLGGMGLGLLLSIPAPGQQWVSVRAGFISYGQGTVFLDQEQLQLSSTDFREVSSGKSLHTGLGWVELQLGPGALLWMSARSALKMENASLLNTQLRLEQGSVLVRVLEEIGSNRIAIRFGASVVEITEAGLYRIEGAPALVRVYDGKADVVQTGRRVTVKKGKAAELAGGLTVSRFDTEQRDLLQEIGARRSHLVYRMILESRRNDFSRSQREELLRQQQIKMEQLLRQQADAQQQQQEQRGRARNEEMQR